LIDGVVPLAGREETAIDIEQAPGMLVGAPVTAVVAMLR